MYIFLYSFLLKMNSEKIDHQIGVGDFKIDSLAKEYVADVLNQNRLSHGKYLRKFEEDFARIHNVDFALTCSSGTDALRIALACLKETENWEDGDEILVPAITFIATSNTIIQNNLKPVFVDIEKDYYCIDPGKIEEKITSRTKAIIPVHLFGLPCDMEAIMRIAKKHNLKIIEDSCECMFVRHKNKFVGTFGDFACFSTYACHIITTGVGGIITTNNSKNAIIAKSLINHGRDSIYLNIDDDKGVDREKLFKIVEKRFKFERLGYSSRLTELEGAVGLAQLEKKDEFIKKRQENAGYFVEKLSKFSNCLQLPKIRPETEHAFMMFPIVVKNIKKEEIVNFLEENNIETRDMMPLINQPIYLKMFGDIEDDYPVAKNINENGFYIGCQPQLTEEEKEYIIKKFEEFFDSKKGAETVVQIEPWIGKEEAEQVREAVESTFVTEWKKTEEFEKKFSELTGSKHCIAYCNGTMSLFAALKLLGIGRGDEVIVPDITFIASANAVLLAGAIPVFVDVDRETFQINPVKIEEKITSRTKAIMPVHLYGQSCDMEAIMRIAKKYDLKVIEDAAQAVGVKFNGKHVGTFGDFGSFSFYGNKTITTGEGGMLLTNDDKLAEEAYAFKNHGRAKKGIFLHEKIGFNFSFTEMQAALGLAQLSKLERIKNKKEDIRKHYQKGLSDIPEIKFSSGNPRCQAVFWFTNIFVPDAEGLQQHLLKNKIQTRRIFYPLHLQPCYSFMNIKENFPDSEYVYKHGLSLPSSATINSEQLAKIVKSIREFYRK